MNVNQERPSPSFALLNQETVWNTRSLKVYLLEHHSPVPEGQFNETSIRVPTPTKLCPKKNCPCPKAHLQKLYKKDIFHIADEEKTDVQKQLFILSCAEMTLSPNKRSTLYSMCLKHKLVLSQL